MGDLCSIFSGFAFSSSLFNSAGDGLPLIRIRDVNTGFSNTYYSGEYNDRFLVKDGDILIGMDGDFGITRWRHGLGLLNQRVCRVEGVSSRVLPEFLYFQIQAALGKIHVGIQSSTVKHLSTRTLVDWRIPVPPLEVQREIVAILGSFTELEAELESELESELEARLVQFAHLRGSLLGGMTMDSTWRPMGVVGEFARGRRFTRADVVDGGIPSIHYGEIYTHYGVAASTSVRQVRQDLRPQLRFASPGDVVIASVGETVEDVGKAVAWLGDEPVAIHDDTFGFRHSLNPKFVAYWMQTEAFHSQKTRHVASAKIKRLSSASLASILMPVPPMEEQLRVVEILDKFDALVNELSIGLPAEFAARRKQYEYYRDKLLTFEEAPA